MTKAVLCPQEDIDNVLVQLALYTREDASVDDIPVRNTVNRYALCEYLVENSFVEYLNYGSNESHKIRLTRKGRDRAHNLMGEHAISEEQYTYDKERVVYKDRQLKILKMLNKRQGELVYSPEDLEDLKMPFKSIFLNMLSLRSEGLIEAQIREGLGGHIGFGGAQILPKGISYLSEDSIHKDLGVLTIRLDEASIKHTLEMFIQMSNKPQSQKDKMLEALKRVPASILQGYVSNIFSQALPHLPDAFEKLCIALDYL